MWLAGLQWPDEAGLAGHSDGDVAAHAVLRRAAVRGRAGRSRRRRSARPTRSGRARRAATCWRETARLVREAGFEIGNVSVQVIGNRPKVGPRRAEAEEALGRAIGAAVSVSATTTDGLGLTGRGEGLAAIATALVTRVS